MIVPAIESGLIRANEILNEAIEQYRPTAVVGLFSGGNDSTVMVHAMRTLLTHAAHIVTGIGIPSTREFVHQKCHSWNLSLLEFITAPKVYRDIVLQHGFPGAAAHKYAYIRLKERRLNELRNMFVKSSRRDRIVFVTGIRASESSRRMRRVMEGAVKREGSQVWVSPLFYWDSRTMAEYRINNQIPQCEASGLIHRSGECLCGAFAKPGEMKELELWFPDMANYIHGLEGEVRKAGHPLCVWGMTESRRKYAIPGQLCMGCVADG